MSVARVGGSLRQVLSDGIDKAVRIQHAVVANHVQRIRRRRPGAEPAEIIAALEKHYLATLTGAGAAVGAAAAVPGVGAVVALALIAADTAAFLEATALFTLAVAEVRGVPVESVKRRRTLLLALLLGKGETALADQTSTRLRRWLVMRYRAQHWILAISKILPFGIGAAIGAAGNRAYGRTVVAASRQMFDPAPQTVTPGISATPGFSASTPMISDPDPLVIAEAQPAPSATENQPATPVVEDKPAAEPTFEDTAAAEPTVGDIPAKPTVEDQTAPEPAPVAPPNSQPPAGSTAQVAGKYRPLFDYLAACETDRIEVSFFEIDHMVTGGLPKSASAQRGWWANSPGRVQAKAWLAAGFQVTNVNLAATTVRFERRR